MTNRIFRSILLASLGVFLASLVFIMGILQDYYNSRLTLELENEAAFVVSGIENGGLDFLKNAGSSNRVTWVDSDGGVIYDTKAPDGALENHADREEIIEAFETGVGESRRYSSTLSERTANYAVLMDDGTVVRVSSNQFSFWVLLVSMLQPILVVSAIAVILSILLARALSKKIVRPLNEIDIENPPSDSAYPELAPLARRIRRQNLLIDRQMDDLRQKEEEFRAITENMSEGFIITDKAGRVLSGNKSALEIIGAAAQNGADTLSDSAPEPLRAAVSAAMSDGHGEAELQSGGLSFQLLANSVVDGQEITGVVVLVLDVTEKLERDRLRRDFSASVSHELKTPLTSIRGISDMLANGLIKPEDIQRFSKNIYDEAGRLIELVNDIMKLSRLDEGADAEDMSPVDIYAVARASAARLEPVAEAKKVKLSVSGSTAWVTGMPSVIDEMITNLCDNAIKYNRENGSVTVFAGPGDDGRPEITVSDTGVGIPKEDLPRVFERFYRVDKSRSKAVPGTGLGLSIVKHAAVRHNARVSIDSTPGVGTAVRIAF